MSGQAKYKIRLVLKTEFFSQIPAIDCNPDTKYSSWGVVERYTPAWVSGISSVVAGR